MRNTIFQLLGSLTIAALVLSACNMPSANATPEAAAQPSATVIESTATPTSAPADTATVTATETLTPEPSATATPEPPVAEVVRESNCRTGPGGLYKLVAKYQVGQEIEIVARDLGGGYWFVQNPQKSAKSSVICWGRTSPSLERQQPCPNLLLRLRPRRLRMSRSASKNSTPAREAVLHFLLSRMSAALHSVPLISE